VLRFRREAEVAARLDHPNCVHVFEFGTWDEEGLFFIVMELLEGAKLADTLDAPRTIRQVLHIGASVLRGLVQAHQVGLIHRDIGPGSLFLTRDPDGEERVTILDFGLAKVSEADPASAAQFTMAGVANNVSRYLSPEQVLDLPADERSDLFCLGMVLYSLLAGRQPFEKCDQVEWVQRHIGREVPRLPANVPLPAAGVVYRLCKKERERRYQTAAAALADFELALAQCEADGVADRPAREIAIEPDPPEPPPPAVRRRSFSWDRAVPPPCRPWLLAAAGTVSLATVIVLVTPVRATEVPVEPVAAPPANPEAAREVADSRALRLLGMVNDPEFAARLSYRQRHAYLGELERAPKVAAMLDRRLNTALDLEQASDAPERCAALSLALDEVELDPGPHYADALGRVVMPHGATGPGCEDLQARIDALRPSATRDEPAPSPDVRRVPAPGKRERVRKTRSKRRAARRERDEPAPWTRGASEIKNPYE
jgi:hypothetical protein